MNKFRRTHTFRFQSLLQSSTTDACYEKKGKTINQLVKLLQSLGRVVIALQVTGETSLNVEKVI